MKYSYQGRRVMLSKFFDMELPKHDYMIDNVIHNEESVSSNSQDKDTFDQRKSAFSDVVYDAMQASGIKTPENVLL